MIGEVQLNVLHKRHVECGKTESNEIESKYIILLNVNSVVPSALQNI